VKMLPTLAPNTTITENGHYMVRPVRHLWAVVNSLTDEALVFCYEKEYAEAKAIELARREQYKA